MATVLQEEIGKLEERLKFIESQLKQTNLRVSTNEAFLWSVINANGLKTPTFPPAE